MDKHPIRGVLASNLEKLVAATPGSPKKKKTQNEVAGGGKKTRSQSTISRMLNQESSARIDTLAAIAPKFGLAAWQLLVPNLDPAVKPMLLDLRDAGEAELLQLYRNMDKDTRPALLSRARKLYAADAPDESPETPDNAAPQQEQQSKKLRRSRG